MTVSCLFDSAAIYYIVLMSKLEEKRQQQEEKKIVEQDSTIEERAIYGCARIQANSVTKFSPAS